MGKEENVNRGKHSVSEPKRPQKSKKTKKSSSKSKNNRGYNDIVSFNSNKKKDSKSSSKGKNKKKMNSVLKAILITLITILIIFCAIFGTYLYKSGGNFAEAFKSMMKDVVGDQDPIFVLVLGVSEDISAELTDTIMLIGYNPDNNQAFVLSIPRDTFVGTNEARAGGFDKINALYQKDPQKTVAAVEELTGVKIDHYVTIKTSVLVQIVDSLGGVEFDVPINMDYDDPTQDLHIHLKAGPQKLNGDQAEQLVRFRHNNNGTTYSASYGDNDEGRMRTQREFLKVVAQQVTQTRNVDQIKQITNAVFDNLDTDITLGKALGYVPYAIDVNVGELQMEQLPGTPAKLNNLWFFKADKEKSYELVREYVDKLGLSEDEKKHYLKEPEKKQEKTQSKSENTKKNTNTTKTESTTTTKKNTTNSTNKSNTSNTTQKNTTSNTTKKNTASTNKNNTGTTSKPTNNSTTENKKPSNTEKNENSTNKNESSGGNETTKPSSTPSESGGNTSGNTGNTGNTGENNSNESNNNSGGASSEGNIE